MNGDRETGDDGEKKNVSSKEETGDLIPGLPNDVVLQLVAPRIAWNAALALTAVSGSWRRAIRSGEVHQLKKRSTSTQTLVVIYTPAECDRRLALYDVERREVYLLPPHPPSFKKSRWGKHLAVLDGRIFVMGTLCVESEGSELSTSGGTSGVILALDIGVCQGVWARYPCSRVFGYSDICVPCEGKIYVFDKTNLASGEVFDPGCNEWSRIAEPPRNKVVQFPSVANLNEEIFFFSTTEGRSSLVYNAEAEDWQVIETAASCIGRTFCVMDGKLYRFHCTSVEVYNAESNSWAHFQSISYSGVEAGYPVRVVPFDREVLTLLEYSCLIRVVRQSVGFGVEGKSLVWKETPCPAFQKFSEDFRVKFDGYQFFEGSVEF